LVLTGSGDEARTAIPFLHPGMLVIDDTHPAMKRDVRQAILDM